MAEVLSIDSTESYKPVEYTYVSINNKQLAAFDQSHQNGLTTKYGKLQWRSSNKRVKSIVYHDTSNFGWFYCDQRNSCENGCSKLLGTSMRIIVHLINVPRLTVSGLKLSVQEINQTRLFLSRNNSRTRSVQESDFPKRIAAVAWNSVLIILLSLESSSIPRAKVPARTRKYIPVGSFDEI